LLGQILIVAVRRKGLRVTALGAQRSCLAHQT